MFDGYPCQNMLIQRFETRQPLSDFEQKSDEFINSNLFIGMVIKEHDNTVNSQ